MALTLQQKLAQGIVPTPADYAAASGGPNVGSMLQGSGASLTPDSLPAPVQQTSDNGQPGGGGQTPVVVQQPAVTGAASSGTNSYANMLLHKTAFNGKTYDMTTPAGQMQYYTDVSNFQLGQHDIANKNLQTNLTTAQRQAQAAYDAAHSSMEGQYSQIGNQAKTYANSYLTNAEALDNAHGTNLAQIGANYQAASPGVLQSSEAYDNDYANNEYTKGTAALINDRNTNIGANFIKGVDAKGNVQYGSLNDLDPTSVLGGQKNATDQGIASLENQYTLAGQGAQNQYNQSVQQNDAAYNANKDSTANNLYSIDAYAGLTGFKAPSTNYAPANLQNTDITAFTGSPITSGAANQNPATQAFFAPPGAANSTPQQQYLGFSPGSTQYGDLSKFLTANGS